jgi:hypothetical protein
MTIGELVFRYACVFFVLLVALVVSLLYHRSGTEKSAGKFSLRCDWQAVLLRIKEQSPPLDFWLKTLLAAFTALAAGLIVVIFILPYGSALALSALSVIGAALFFCIPKLLA